MDAATVAQAGYDGAMAGRRVVIPGLMNRVRVLAARLSPRRVSAALALRLNRTPG
jgi:short-subunit dehydrogenase